MATIEQIKNEINSRIDRNFDRIQNSFNTPYNWPLLDPIRIEICYCIFIETSQAAITLTNHLLEKALKAFLIHFEKTNHNYSDLAEIENHIEKLNIQYGDLDLHNTINKCNKNGIIAKDVAKILQRYREKFRNSFCHAESNKIFNGKKERIGIFNPLIHTTINIHDANIANFPFLQGFIQKKIADNEHLDYFKYVDGLIRIVMKKIFTVK